MCQQCTGSQPFISQRVLGLICLTFCSSRYYGLCRFILCFGNLGADEDVYCTIIKKTDN